MDSILCKFNRKPRIAILADRPEWAYDYCARNVRNILSNQFEIDIYYVNQHPTISPQHYDVLHVCFWGETYHHKFNFPPSRVIKEVSSHRWQYDAPYGPLATSEFVKRYLDDAHTVVATSLALYNMVREHHDDCYHIKNGFDPDNFFPSDTVHSGPLKIAWCGNVADQVKGIDDILKPAAEGYALHLATGNIQQRDLIALYNQCDIYAVCSSHEASPLPLIEAMACGCFPVCTTVGVVPELVRHKDNGYIVAERSVEAFSEAFAWCSKHLQEIREKRLGIADELRSKRTWSICAQSYRYAWVQALTKAFFPVFRNDDVAPDTDVANFKAFCNIFHSNAFTQVHAVTLSGCCNVVHDYGGMAAEYAKLPPLCYWKNEDICRASQPKQMEDCKELVDYLNTIEDELAFHGTAHVDFSQMSAEEQDAEFASGIERMRRLFPHKKVRLFVPPFNRVNEHTERVAAKHGLTVMKPTGVHFEESLANHAAFTHSEYRYHHHRFYPQSQFAFYNLSLEALKGALCKKVALADSCQSHKRGQLGNVAQKFSKIGLRIGRKVKRAAMRLCVEYTTRNFWGVPIALVDYICRKNGASAWHVYAYRHIMKRAFTFDLLCWINNNISKDSAIFEAGCGTGQNLFALDKWGFSNLAGVEIDDGACRAFAQLKKHLCSSDIIVKQGDLFAGFCDKRYGFIYSLDVLYLIPGNSLEHFLSQARESLKQSGYVAFDVIDKAFEAHPLRSFCTQDWHDDVKNKRPSEYQVTHSHKDVEGLARNCGYKIIYHKFYEEVPQRSVYILQLGD